MNHRGKTKFTELRECKICGMDSGIRKVTNSVPEQFFVVCETCGHKTKMHKSLAHATREWNRG